MAPSCSCEFTDRHFTRARAEQELARYRRRGPTGTARLLLHSIRVLGLDAETLLDVGAGIGVLHHELLRASVQHGVHVEAAAAYVEAARAEARRRGQESRMRFLHGDFLALAPSLASADLVTLDRVVCCYPDLDPLLRAAAAKATRYLALSFPHDRWYMRAHRRLQNGRRRRAGNPFRTFVHRVSRIHDVLQEAGFQVRIARKTLGWEADLCVRLSDGHGRGDAADL